MPRAAARQPQGNKSAGRREDATQPEKSQSLRARAATETERLSRQRAGTAPPVSGF